MGRWGDGAMGRWADREMGISLFPPSPYPPSPHPSSLLGMTAGS
jgi:hypothetical protein